MTIKLSASCGRASPGDPCGPIGRVALWPWLTPVALVVLVAPVALVALVAPVALIDPSGPGGPCGPRSPGCSGGPGGGIAGQALKVLLRLTASLKSWLNHPQPVLLRGDGVVGGVRPER